MSTGKLDGKALANLLAKVYLGGLVNECLLEIEKGTAIVCALDDARAVYIYAEDEIEADDLKIGLSNLGTILKLFSRGGQIEYTIQDRYLNLLLPNKEKVKLLTIEPDQVHSVPRTKINIDKMIANSDVASFTCTGSVLEKLCEYRGLLVVKTISLWTRGGYAHMGSSSTRERQFTVPRIAELDGGWEGDNIGEFYGDHLELVLKAALAAKDEVKVYLGASGVPLVVTQGKSWWMLVSFGEPNK